jgi:hypothetical protein
VCARIRKEKKRQREHIRPGPPYALVYYRSVHSWRFYESKTEAQITQLYTHTIGTPSIKEHNTDNKLNENKPIKYLAWF